MQHGDLIVRAQGALRRITLNRPKALNALTLDMAATMLALLRGWAAEPAVGAVLLDGAGERGLCAGGDIRALYDAAKTGDRTLPEKFWATEYYLEATSHVPLSQAVRRRHGWLGNGWRRRPFGARGTPHCHRALSHRLAGSRHRLRFRHRRLFSAGAYPGFAGTYLALTGERANAADAIYCGLADVHIASSELAALPAALAACRSADDVRVQLGALASPPPAGRIGAARPALDRCVFWRGRRREPLLRASPTPPDEAAQATLAAMQKMSPTSLKVTLRNVRDAAGFKHVGGKLPAGLPHLACMPHRPRFHRGHTRADRRQGSQSTLAAGHARRRNGRDRRPAFQASRRPGTTLRRLEPDDVCSNKVRHCEER